jgi:hypothetical protein
VRLKKVILIILSFFLISPAALAQKVEIITSATNVIVYTNEVQTIDVTIKNMQTESDIFSLSVSPSPIPGVNANLEKYAVEINANSTTTVKLYFSAAIDAPELISAFTITARSITNEDVTSSKSVYLRVIRKTDVYISDLKLSKYALNPEETLTIDVQLTSVSEKPSGLYTLQTIIKKDDSIVQRFDETVVGLGPKLSKTVSNSYFVKKYETPGTYAVDAILKDSLNNMVSAMSSKFKVNEVSKLPTEYTAKTTDIGFLSVTTTIMIKNEGNVPTPTFYVTESIPTFAEKLFVPEIEPTSSKKSDNRIVYSWLVPSLQPGQQVTIRYKFSLLAVWLAILAIIAIVYLAYRLTFAPTIVKKHRHKGEITRDKEILISLDVRNRTIREIKDVIVKDRVPSIAKVVDKFDTLKPKIKVTDAGTELYWKFDSLKPREERILTYRIKPVVDVMGALKLPHAVIRYTDQKKEKKVVSSKSLIIKPK